MSVVAAETDAGLDKYSLLERVLEQGGLYPALERELARSGKSRESFRIAIKPNLAMMLRRADVGTYTDPFLVIHLARILLKRGYRNLVVVESQNLYGAWFERRSVVEIAARAGYLEDRDPAAHSGRSAASFQVRGGGADGRVELVDLTLDPMVHDFGPPFGPTPLGRAWVEADFRINFAKMKTHFYSLYTLALKNIYGCLPLQDKVRGYHCLGLVGPLTARLIEEFPPRFSIVDGYSAADGWIGVKIKAVCRKPHTLIAGEDVVAVDHFGARLLGIDPHHSVIFAEVAKRVPLKDYQVVGRFEQPRPWSNSPRIFAEFCRLIEPFATFMDFAGALSTGGHDPCFPHNRQTTGPFKRALYLLTAPANELSDPSRLRLEFRKRALRLRLNRRRSRFPIAASSGRLLAALPYLSSTELRAMAQVLGFGLERPPACSGHYLFFSGRELALPFRMSVSNLALLEALDKVLEARIDPGKLGSELKDLADWLEASLEDSSGYPYCFT